MSRYVKKLNLVALSCFVVSSLFSCGGGSGDKSQPSPTKKNKLLEIVDKPTNDTKKTPANATPQKQDATSTQTAINNSPVTNGSAPEIPSTQPAVTEEPNTTTEVAVAAPEKYTTDPVKGNLDALPYSDVTISGPWTYKTAIIRKAWNPQSKDPQFRRVTFYSQAMTDPCNFDYDTFHKGDQRYVEAPMLLKLGTYAGQDTGWTALYNDNFSTTIYSITISKIEGSNVDGYLTVDGFDHNFNDINIVKGYFRATVCE